MCFALVTGEASDFGSAFEVLLIQFSRQFDHLSTDIFLTNRLLGESVPSWQYWQFTPNEALMMFMTLPIWSAGISASAVTFLNLFPDSSSLSDCCAAAEPHNA